jgi:uncharacterized phage-associated protein
LKEKISLSPMKLQKLIYFTYRDYLKGSGNKLFSERISAWRYGPVVESVYNHFKPFEAQSINKFYRNGIGDVLKLSESSEIFGSVIKSVWEKYRGFSGIELSKITHRKGTAWHKAWLNDDDYLNDEDIKNEPSE